MSRAGVESNRGDGYQTLVAMGWALTVISDPDYEWIEVDSIAYEDVDDIVIGKKDGKLICCQCKKNQPKHNSWTIGDLSDELGKASIQLNKDPNSEVRFYSRSPFGEISKLREYCITHPDEMLFIKNLGKGNIASLREIDELLQNNTPTLTSFEFLKRITFEVSQELGQMKYFLKERLRFQASNSDAAYNALWTAIDLLGARMAEDNSSATTSHRLTRDQLIGLIRQVGSILTPPVKIQEVVSSVHATSAIGRSWSRDISGQRLHMPALQELQSAIDAKYRSILLTGLPGSGKTCVMLALQEYLEQRAESKKDLLPLFIQSREFANLSTPKECHSMGLPERWVEFVARASEEILVVVVIDSLDVLSIARDHKMLTYFLGQIDRLLAVPKIKVITSCRDFDRHYDYRIAQRKWDYECKCSPLNWESDVIPLLSNLGIGVDDINEQTRELICNHRELALFVELAKSEGGFSVVNSQSLAQNYLIKLVQNNNILGDDAMRAIEGAATEMLYSRSLKIQRQRILCTDEMLRNLCSCNILGMNQNGDVYFGHQTLLDVLTISAAIRKNLTLIDFIKTLPPVPFVRPSIRYFVSYLASTENRQQYRSQLRAVFASDIPFHVRRLVAESYAEHSVLDDDWPMIRDLRTNHNEVFQVIHTQAQHISWHHFWLRHLVPVLKDSRNEEGMHILIHQASRWLNISPQSVIDFWTDAIKLDWLNAKQSLWRISYDLSNIDDEHLALIVPLLMQLLEMPRPEHDCLGRSVSRCMSHDLLDDSWLWRYMVGEIEEDVYSFGVLNKLRCRKHDFGDVDNDFLYQRMISSAKFLDIVLSSIEKWSLMKCERLGYPQRWHSKHFLDYTSYIETHTKMNSHHNENGRCFFKKTESAIAHHAQNNSQWWISNRERLCRSNEGALLYIVIRTMTQFPAYNTDMIGKLLQDIHFLESNLSFEVGDLINASFPLLDSSVQNEITTCILSIWSNAEDDNSWIQRERSELISTIPGYLRSPEAQGTLSNYEASHGRIIRQPHIEHMCGFVEAPFQFEIFGRLGDCDVLRLLVYYANIEQSVDSFVGGRDSVGRTLREASSRQPNRFISLLRSCRTEIHETFIDAIIQGAANYLAYRHGNTKPQEHWEPIEQIDALELACKLLGELESHPGIWYHNRTASEVLNACSHVVEDTNTARRLVFLAIGFENFHKNHNYSDSESERDLITDAINMVKGRVAQALLILANNLATCGIEYPDLLAPTLHRYAQDDEPAIRAIFLHYLPCLQNANPEIGWKLFGLATMDSTGIWKYTERVLYYAYYKRYEYILPFLNRMKHEGKGNDLKVWARISALSVLAGHIAPSEILSELISLDCSDAWSGAASVWVYPENIQKHRQICLDCVDASLALTSKNNGIVAQRLIQERDSNNDWVSIPTALFKKSFTLLERDNEYRLNLTYRFNKWLNAASLHDPKQALDVAEIYLPYMRRTKINPDDYDNNFTQLLTRLFAEAEECEQSDKGSMLARVVKLQDLLLSLGVRNIRDWLKAAERP